MTIKFQYKQWLTLVFTICLLSCAENENVDLLSPAAIDLGGQVFNSDGLSSEYDEYYSGNWKGSMCGGNGQAILGISGAVVELNTRASYMATVMGSIDSTGNISFQPRQVNWDCETCGEVRPLEIVGSINRVSHTGNISFEVACGTSSGVGHVISNVVVELQPGISQPMPDSELIRIHEEAINLIEGSVQSCTQNLECKAFNIDESDTYCNHYASAYSISVTNESVLIDLQNQYSYFKWLSNEYSMISTTTYCWPQLYSTCELNICVMR